jgi:hypothetical protein
MVRKLEYISQQLNLKKENWVDIYHLNLFESLILYGVTEPNFNNGGDSHCSSRN